MHCIYVRSNPFSPVLSGSPVRYSRVIYCYCCCKQTITTHTIRA